MLAVRGLTRGPGDNRLGDETRTLKLAVSRSPQLDTRWRPLLSHVAVQQLAGRASESWQSAAQTKGTSILHYGLRFRWVPRESGAKPELSRNCEWGAPVQPKPLR